MLVGGAVLLGSVALRGACLVQLVRARVPLWLGYWVPLTLLAREVSGALYVEEPLNQLMQTRESFALVGGSDGAGVPLIRGPLGEILGSDIGEKRADAGVSQGES